jgi:hypothetical protein
MHLNSLLSLPFIQCQVENFYSGTLIYNAYLNFKKHSDVEDYVLTQLLRCSPSVAALYSVMVKLVTDILPDSSVTQRKKKNKRKKKNDSKCYDESVLGDESTSEKSKPEEMVEFIDCNTFSGLRLCGSNQ